MRKLISFPRAIRVIVGICLLTLTSACFAPVYYEPERIFNIHAEVESLDERVTAIEQGLTGGSSVTDDDTGNEPSMTEAAEGGVALASTLDKNIQLIDTFPVVDVTFGADYDDLIKQIKEWGDTIQLEFVVLRDQADPSKEAVLYSFGYDPLAELGSANPIQWNDYNTLPSMDANQDSRNQMLLRQPIALSRHEQQNGVEAGLSFDKQIEALSALIDTVERESGLTIDNTIRILVSRNNDGNKEYLLGIVPDDVSGAEGNACTQYCATCERYCWICRFCR